MKLVIWLRWVELTNVTASKEHTYREKYFISDMKLTVRFEFFSPARFHNILYALISIVNYMINQNQMFNQK